MCKVYLSHVKLKSVIGPNCWHKNNVGLHTLQTYGPIYSTCGRIWSILETNVCVCVWGGKCEYVLVSFPIHGTWDLLFLSPNPPHLSSLPEETLGVEFLLLVSLLPLLPRGRNAMISLSPALANCQCQSFLQFNLAHFIPVSYTHLDVYKRQIDQVVLRNGVVWLT